MTSHARAAWVLASDLASTYQQGDVRKVVKHHSGTRGRTVDDTTARCRKIACYLATVTADVPAERLAEASGLNRRTIHRHVEWVEEARDDDAFDAMVQRLEETLVLMCARVVLARAGELAPAEGGV